MVIIGLLAGYVAPEQGLAALMTAPAGAANWQGPYLKKSVPPDPWKNSYQYRQPGEHVDFDIYSFGRDGKPGVLTH